MDQGKYVSANDPARMPAYVWDELVEIYHTSPTTLKRARRFATVVRTREEAEVIAKKYRTWSRIDHGFLAGHTTGETQAIKDEDAGKVKAARRIAQHVAQHAIVTIPDAMRDELALLGYDAAELFRDILAEMDAEGVVSVADQLGVIQRPKRVPRVKARSAA